MNSRTVGTLFAGCGGSTMGAKLAGYTAAWGLDFWPIAVEVYKSNYGYGVAGDIRTANPSKFEPVDLLLASPSCKNFSILHHGNKESDTDRETALGTARFIRRLRPGGVIIENVSQYKGSESLTIILDELAHSGYLVDIGVYNAVDFGLGQRRVRLIVRAVLPKVARLNDVVLSAEQKSWWDVTNDLHSNMAHSELTLSQVHNLKNKFKYDCSEPGKIRSYPPGEYLVQRIGYRKSSIQIIPKDKPSPTVIASFTNDRKATGQQKRLFEEYLRETLQVSEADLKRTAAVTAWPIHLEKGSARNNFYNWATVHEDGEITSKNVNMPFLARLQGFPDDYNWNRDIRWDGEMIGNAVPPPMMKALVESIEWT